MIHNLYIQIYIQPCHRLMGLCLVCLLLFWGLRRLLGRFRWWRPMLVCVLLTWVAVVLLATVVGRNGDGTTLSLVPFHSYREVLAGGNPELLRSNQMNLFLFLPGGLLLASLLPEDWAGKRRLVWVVGSLCLLSVDIELVQFFHGLGQAEIDDVIHNTLGAGLGCLCSGQPVRMKKGCCKMQQPLVNNEYGKNEA